MKNLLSFWTRLWKIQYSIDISLNYWLIICYWIIQNLQKSQPWYLMDPSYAPTHYHPQSLQPLTLHPLRLTDFSQDLQLPWPLSILCKTFSQMCWDLWHWIQNWMLLSRIITEPILQVLRLILLSKISYDLLISFLKWSGWHGDGDLFPISFWSFEQDYH